MQGPGSTSASNFSTFGRLVNDEYFILNRIEEGEYENVYIVERIGRNDIGNNEQFIMKASPNSNCPYMLKQIEVYTELNIIPNSRFRRMHYNGMFQGQRVIILSMLGDTVEERRVQTQNGALPINDVVRIGIELIKRVEALHAANYIHGNISPSKCSFGKTTCNPTRVCLTGFTQSHRYMQQVGTSLKHVRISKLRSGSYHHNLLFGSVRSNEYRRQGRCDDLMSVFYVIIFLYLGNVPWNDANVDIVVDMKKALNEDTSILFQVLPHHFRQFFSHIRTLKYSDKPEYNFLVYLLNQIIEEQAVIVL